MKTVNIHFAKTHLSRLLDEAAAGEEVVIAKAGKPRARLIAIQATEGPRKLGRLAGKIRESKDAWAADSETEELFYGAPVEPTPVRKVAERKRKR